MMGLRMRYPDALRSVESYRRLADGYDESSMADMPIRDRAVALLALKPGDVAIDVASGTGLSFGLIMNAIGPTGHLIAIEHSPEMMTIARRRVEAAGWHNVSLIQSAVEDASVPHTANAILFHCTHDVLQSPAALAVVFAAARDGARVAVVGAKFTSWWLAPLNLWVLFRTRRYLSTYGGLDRPWRHLASYVPDLRVSSHLQDTGYLAHGRYRVQSAEPPSTCIK